MVRGLAHEAAEKPASPRSDSTSPAPTNKPWAGHTPERLVSASFVDVFRESRGVVLLGGPGSGKTTVVRRLATAAAAGAPALEAAFGVREELLPLPVSVGLLAEHRRRSAVGITVVDAMAPYLAARCAAREPELHAFLEDRLASGACLVLLDGLDEVHREERRAVSQWLEGFANRYPANRFVVTSRVVGYAHFRLPSGVEVTLRAFSDAQVKAFVRSYFRACWAWENEDPAGSGSETAAMDFLAALRANPRMAGLARSPFLLSALALVHRAEGKLPRHRVAAYDMFARALCETWDEARRLSPVSPGTGATATASVSYEEEAIPILGELAIRMHERYPAGIAPDEFVRRTLEQALRERVGLSEADARPAVDRFLSLVTERSPILQERGPGNWGFFHLTFQEFFAALGLHYQDRFETVAWEHLFHARWREVIRLGLGYQAIVQKRGRATQTFVERVWRQGRDSQRPWVTEVLRKHVPLAVLLAAEAGDALSPNVQQGLVHDFVQWAPLRHPEISSSLMTDLAQSVLREQIVRLFPFDPCYPNVQRLHYLEDYAREPGDRPRASRVVSVLTINAGGNTLWVSENEVNEALSAVRPGSTAICTARNALAAAIEPQEKIVAALILARLGGLEAVPGLLDLLNSDHEVLRNGGVWILGELAAEVAVPALLGPAKAGDQDALAALWKISEALE